MEPKVDRLYSFGPLEIFESEQRLEKKTKDVNSFNNSITYIKELITFFKEKNNNPKKKFKRYKTLSTIIKLFDAINFIATTSSSITLSLTGFGLLDTNIKFHCLWLNN